MAALVWSPPTTANGGALEVRQSGVIYTFWPGVARNIPQEHYAAVQTAVRTSTGLLVSPTPVITQGGAAGTTSYSYEVVALNANGDTLPGTVVTTTTGNATLNGTTYNIVTWGAVSGATQYKVIRTASAGTPSTTGLIGTVPALTTVLNDTGLAGSVYAPAGAAVGNSAATAADVEM